MNKEPAQREPLPIGTLWAEYQKNDFFPAVRAPGRFPEFLQKSSHKYYAPFQESTEAIGNKKIMIWYGGPLISKVQLGIFYGGPPPSDPRRLGSVDTEVARAGNE